MPPSGRVVPGTNCVMQTRITRISSAPRKTRPTGWVRVLMNTGRAIPGSGPLRRRCRARRAASALFAFLAWVPYDLGHVSSREPYRRLVNQGYIQAFAYTDSRAPTFRLRDVVEREGKFFLPGPDGEVEVFQEFGKIGKSLKNSISPDEICDSYGADTLRVYEMSMGPLEASRPWATKDVVGAHRFLQRVWRLVVDENSGAQGRRMTRLMKTPAGAASHHRRCLGRLCRTAE